MDETKHLRNILLDWYDCHRREMPWRALPSKKPNPYYVLVSEFMLQQTTVQTVRDYFQRFIAQFPTLDDLANAELDEVYVLWQGLGYYSRAKNLWKSAQQIRDFHHSIVPSNINDLSKLIGVGPYTSHAVASIAYDKPHVPVDGNVIRVLSRVMGIQIPLPGLKKEIDALSQKFIDQDRAGDFAQALMDLGATVCKPKNPMCDICPWQKNCVSQIKGIQEIIPLKQIKEAVEIRYGICFLNINPSFTRISLVKRPDKGIWANMMCFPMSDFVKDQALLKGMNLQYYQTPFEWKHIFTHFQLKLKMMIKICSEDDSFYPISDLGNLAMPTLARKILKQLPDILLWVQKNAYDAA